jgi:nicotinate-nucleotide adenylyltransferase
LRTVLFEHVSRGCAPALETLRGCSTLLLYGGGFDPPHRAHLELPALVRARVGADFILYIPAARTPLKDEGPFAPDADRLEMLRLALREIDGAALTNLELVRGGTSYTIDTLRSLRGLLGDGASFRLLIGADQARSFHRWKAAREVVELAEPVVMRRPDDDGDLLEAMRPHWASEEMEAWEGRLVETPLVDVSSTAIREALRTGGVDDEVVRRSVPEAVREHIRSRGLYADAARRAEGS